jgi:dihydroorotase
MSGLIIRNGKVICPATRRDEIADLWIEAGRFRTPLHEIPDGFDVFDATGLIVVPGFIDLHVHLRESIIENPEVAETIKTGTEAAAVGGFTSVCAMPNTQPVNDSVEITRFMVERAKAEGAVRVFPIAAVTKSSAGEALTDFESLMATGAVGFSDDGKPVKTASLMREALALARKLNTFVSDHCEDLLRTSQGVIHEGKISRQLGVEGLSPEAEDSVVERDIHLAEETGGKVHISHLSTAGSLELVRRAKARGVQISCEVAPHHFSLTDEAVLRFGANAKMKPPLRSQEDVDALLEGLSDGTVDAIATDHAPHPAREKERGLKAAPFGIIGLETAVALAIQKLVQPGLVSWARLIELFSTHPARILGRSDLGTLEAGALADLTILDPSREWTFSVADSRSKSRNTPFEGWKFRGKVVATYVGGEMVFDGHKIHRPSAISGAL